MMIDVTNPSITNVQWRKYNTSREVRSRHLHRSIFLVSDEGDSARLTVMSKKQKRPVYLNLVKIRLPVTGVTSIAHRISGALLFLALPLAIYGLGLSLESETGFATVSAWLNHTAVKIVLLLWIWSLAHHMLGGLRFLLIDLDVGLSRQTARRTAWWVNFSALAIVAVIGGMLLI